MNKNIDVMFQNFVNSTASGGSNGFEIDLEFLDRALLELPPELSDKIYPFWEEELCNVLESRKETNNGRSKFLIFRSLLLEILKRGMKRCKIAEAFLEDYSAERNNHDEELLLIAEYVPEFEKKALGLMHDQREITYFLLRKAIREEEQVIIKPSFPEKVLAKVKKRALSFLGK